MQVPPIGLNDTYSSTVLVMKLFLITGSIVVTVNVAIFIFEAKSYGGFAALNKTYETEINFIFWADWTWVPSWVPGSNST